MNTEARVITAMIATSHTLVCGSHKATLGTAATSASTATFAQNVGEASMDGMAVVARFLGFLKLINGYMYEII